MIEFGVFSLRVPSWAIAKIGMRTLGFNTWETKSPPIMAQ